VKLRMLAVGNKMPAWVTTGVEEYRKRMPRECSLEIEEIAPGTRGKNADISRAIAIEGDRMLSRLEGDVEIVALEVNGRNWSTPDLSSQLEAWQLGGRDVAFLVGGPDGLDPRCTARANKKWSLSALTLPHPLVRIVLAEQLYRAWTLTIGHPYHR